MLCWKPFNFCFAKFRRNLSTSDSIINAFASLMLLSFLTMNYNAYTIFNSINVYTANSSSGPLLTGILLYHPTTTHAFLKEPQYICYLVITIMLLFFLGVVPSLLLLLYPIRKFRVQLQRFFSQRLLLKLDTFVETFQGPFKDGLNGTRDFRIVPGILALLILTSSIYNCLRHDNNYHLYIIPLYVVVIATLCVLCAYLHPFKSSSGNLSVTFHLMLSAAIGILYILFMEDLDMNTNVLLFAFVIILPLPHLVMFVWVCYKIQKKVQLQQRCLNTFSYLSGQRVFEQQCSNSLLPDRLINSKKYWELMN